MPEEIKTPAVDEGNDKIPPEGEKAEEEEIVIPDDNKEKIEGAEDKKDEKGDAKAPDDDGKDPVTRKRLSTQDYIIGRQKAKLAKEQTQKDDNKDDSSGDDNDDDDVPAEDEAIINKVIAKTMAPIISKSLDEEDNKEIGTYLTDNPDFKPFEAKARRYMSHPSRASLPIETIFLEVVGQKGLMKLGAERQRLADEKARNSQTGGGSGRGSEGTSNVMEMSKEDFEAEQEKVRRSR